MPSCFLLFAFVCLSVSGEEQGRGGLWDSVKNAVSKGSKTLTGYFSSPGEDNSCSDDVDGEACVREETEEEGIRAERDNLQQNKGVIRTNPLSYYWSQFSEGAGKIYDGMRNKVSTSIGQIHDSVQGAVRTVVYDEMGKLYDIFMPSLSTPGRILLTSVNVLPEGMQTLILVCACLLLVVALARFVSLIFSVAVAMTVYLSFKLAGPYRTIELGVRWTEYMVAFVGYVVYYPKISAVLILALIMGSVFYPLYSWWWSYRERRRLSEMHTLVHDTHARLVLVEEKQEEILITLESIKDKLDKK